MTSPQPTVSDQPDTLMWEVRAEPGRQQELLAWVEERAVPELVRSPGFLAADIYLGGQDRVVAIARFDAGHAPARLPDPPTDVLARSAHQWPFRFHRSVSS
jgi:antibiotic biosynthesis monooxygenase (ABM) superfamily enzyme